MKKIEVIIRPEKLEEVKEFLSQKGIHGMTVTMVSGCGHQKGLKEVYRGTELTINLLPKIKVEIVIAKEKVEMIMDELSAVCSTGSVGDGKAFVSDIENVMRLRTGEKGLNAL